MKMNQIPCSERLPKYDGDYLCCLENKVIRILTYGSCLTLRHPQGKNCSTLLIDLEVRCKGCGIRKKKRLEICDTSFDDINKAMCEAVEDWNRRVDWE